MSVIGLIVIRLRTCDCAEVTRHERVARRWITEGAVAKAIEDQWLVSPGLVADFLTKKLDQPNLGRLQNLLNGPVDVDKMDYLQRDSLHAGVPYGRNFDVARLVSSLRFGESSKIAITDKGKTAAEMMVFSRYVMFSEVYWHHSVRAATAMLQRLFYRIRRSVFEADLHEMSDWKFQHFVIEAAQVDPGIAELASSLFGRQRKLFKRFSQHNYAVSPDVHAALAHRPFEQLVQCAELLAAKLASKCKIPIQPDDLLIDAPPVKLEIQFKLDVLTSKGTQPLEQLSPVVRSLATDQFDKFVKQVRVFVKPSIRSQLNVDESSLTELLLQCASELSDSTS
ncbi:MAG: metal-dependent phosphohydrolase [Pirellulales bacterium]